MHKLTSPSTIAKVLAHHLHSISLAGHIRMRQIWQADFGLTHNTQISVLVFLLSVLSCTSKFSHDTREHCTNNAESLCLPGTFCNFDQGEWGKCQACNPVSMTFCADVFAFKGKAACGMRCMHLPTDKTDAKSIVKMEQLLRKAFP